VTSFPDLARILTEAAQDPASPSVALTVRTAPLPSASAPLPKDVRSGTGPGRTVTLDLRDLRDLSGAAGAAGKDALRRIGIVDSQLTVAEATDTLAGTFQVGDRIVAWNGVPLRDVYQLREQLVNRNEPTAKVTVQRATGETTLDVKLKPIETQRPEGAVTVYTLPLMFWGQPEEPDPLVEKYDGLFAALGYGIRETGVQTGTLVAGLKALITGEVPLKALGGPMLIAKVAGDSARSGWQTFLMAMALISINLGLLNLLPIPVLDGGQLVLMGAEGVKRRPLRETAVENFQKVGFAMILALVVLATYNDLSRFWRSMLESVVGIFQ
jgi:regulator of sigma E protease